MLMHGGLLGISLRLSVTRPKFLVLIKKLKIDFLSPPVLMHGGLLGIALRLSVTRPKFRLDNNSYY